MGFPQLLQLIVNGEVVTAGNANRADLTLDERTRYLYDLLQAANIGSTVFAREETVISTALVGQPVYYNSETQQWEPGLAATETNLGTGKLEAADSSHIWGLIYEKQNATLADILLFGVVDDFDLTNALDGETLAAGQYYLSGTTAGTVTAARPSVTVPVLKTDGNGKVFVNPQWEDFTNHTHFKFELQCLPAGEHTSPGGGRHEITSPDTSIEGWLPADNAIFDGNAPEGAVFGYNLSANSNLANAWPPIPADNADVQWDKGLDADQGFQGVPIGEQGLVVLDENGIWWMSDCYGDVPWPQDLETSSSDSVSEGFGECPRDLTMRMILWFVRLNFLTDSTAVTSLGSDDDRIQVLCASDPTKVASAGALLLRLDLSFSQGGDDAAGFLVFKEYDEATGQFERGPAVEGIYSGSSSLQVTGDTESTREIGGGDQVVQHGLIQITDNNTINRDLPPALIRLLGASEEYYQDVMYLEFPDDEEATVRMVFRVPSTLQLTTPQAKLRLRILGRAAGTLPNLTVTARRLPEPSALLTPEALPLTDSAVTITTSAVLASANEYIDAESDLLTVQPGDDYLFSITRAGSDGYAAALGLLRQALLIVPTP